MGVGSIGHGEYLGEILRIIPRKEGTEKIIEAFFGSRDDVIVRAPAGTGKTFVAVAYAIAEALEGRRTAIFFRTRAELENALGIAKTILEKAGVELENGSVIPLAGREALCPFGPRQFEGLPDFARALYCLVMKCPVRFRRVLESPELYVRLRDYVNFAMGYKACAYHTLLRLAKEAKIIFATHPFLVQDELFRYLGELDNAIIDEAHALNIITFEITEKEYLEGRRLARMFEEGSGEGERRVRDWIIENWAFRREEILTLEKYRFFEKRRGTTLRVNGEILRVMPPRELLRLRRDKVRRSVIMSATLYPIGMIKKLWGIEKVVKIGKILSPTKNRLYISLVVPGLTTRMSVRNQRLYSVVAKLVEWIAREFPEKLVVVFAVSKQFAEEIARRTRRRVVADPEEKVEGNLVITYARGKLSEGIDAVAGRNPDIVIAVGLPYPATDKKFVAINKAIAKRIGIDEKAFLRDIMNSEMITALTQLLGRAGRRRKGACVIVDERAVILRGIPYTTNTMELKKALKKFFGEEA